MTTPLVPFRTAYGDLRPYDSDPPPCALSLADNTSPFGIPPAALASVQEGAHQRLAEYPTTYSSRVCDAFARYVGVSPDEVIVGAGSDEIISCTFRALADPGATVAYMDPTFVMTPVFATTNSLRPIAVPLTASHDADVEALIATRSRMTYICTPNNPTGIQIATSPLQRLCEHAPGLLLVDEAYAEYAGSNLAAMAPSHGRMLVFRTLSKAFGMAGFRVGFAVGARDLILELRKARGPFTVSALSERAALAALDHDVAWVRRGAEIVCKTRDRFVAELVSAGYRVLPSAANFVLLQVADARGSWKTLLDRGIRVRPFAGLPRIGDALRISMASPEAMRDVLTTIREVVPCD